MPAFELVGISAPGHQSAFDGKAQAAPHVHLRSLLPSFSFITLAAWV
jgi:hypothetical protein